MYKTFLFVFGCLILSSCTFKNEPDNYQADLQFYSEDGTYFYTTDTSRIKNFTPSTDMEALSHISEQLMWLGREETWHYNCLFLKSIGELNQYELKIALPYINAVSFAHWEIRNKSYHSAGKLLRESADEGFPLANIKLARMLAEGLGTEANPQAAHQLLMRAASDNCAIAQYELAKLISNQFSDNLKAWGWAKKAADQGHPEAIKLQSTLEKTMNAVHLELARSYMETIRKDYRYSSWRQTITPVECVYTKARVPTTFLSSYSQCQKVGGHAKTLHMEESSKTER